VNWGLVFFIGAVLLFGGAALFWTAVLWDDDGGEGW
jgi:hypothetical protein